MANFWTFEIDDEIHDADFKTPKDCLQAMDDFFAGMVQNDFPSLQNGDKHGCSAKIIRYTYNDDNERDIIFTQEVTAEYEHYHGDLKEHGTWG